MSLLKFINLLLVGLFLSGCASQTTSSVQPSEMEKRRQFVEAKFEEGNRLLDSEQYVEAAKIFDSIMLEQPVNTLDGLIIYNSGLAYQMAGDCAQSADRFRKLIRFAQKSSPFLAVRGKLRLSEAMNCLGDTKKATVLLLEVFRDRQRLPLEVGEAEVPAKLAAAYASMGNRKTAGKFFQVAEQGLRKLQAQKRNDKNSEEILAKTLYVMGSMEQMGGDSLPADIYFATLKTFQPYLLRSANMSINPWSEKAVNEILNAYDNVWGMIEKTPASEIKAEDPVRARRELKARRLEIAQMAQGSLQDFYKKLLPGTELSKPVQQMLAKLKTQEAKLTNFITSEAPGTELTDEALRTQSAKREGRVKSEEKTILEKKRK